MAEVVGLKGCYQSRVNNPNMIYNSDMVIMSTLPGLVLQFIFVVTANRLFFYLLRPLSQPHFVAEFLAGLVLNVWATDKSTLFQIVLPVSGVLIFETLSQMGLIYYVFLTGLEMNLDIVLRVRKKAATVAAAGIFIPMAMGAGIYYVVQNFHDPKNPEHFSSFSKPNAYLLWSLILSVTSLPVLAHILADLKILYTGLGKMALTAATISDFYSWALFALLVPFAINGKMGIFTMMGTLLFGIFCFCVLRPTVTRILEKKTDQNEWHNYQLSVVVIGVFACATVTEVLGAHSVVGALMFGLILPRGDFTNMLIEKTDDIGSGYLAPLFFASIGIRSRIFDVMKEREFFAIAAIMVMLVSTKIVSTVLATRFYGMPIRDSLALGVLMNTKGILPLIILNIACDRKVLSDRSFSIMVLGIFLMTFIVSPIINLMYKPRMRYEKLKLRTIENLKVDSEIRVMVCVHNARQPTGMINILEACSSTNLSPLRVFAIQLVELKGRATALLIDQLEQPTSLQSGLPTLDQPEAKSDIIASAFEEYSLNHEHASVESLVAMSSYHTIHKDIFNLALEGQASLVLLPFHKEIGSGSTLEITNPAFKDINQNVMQDAPCSVGIFVDRGLGSLSNTSLRVIMIFIGGPDDREALAIAWRMSKKPTTQLSLVRIILRGNVSKVHSSSSFDDQGLLTNVIDTGKQKKLDDEYVDTFRLTAVNNDDSITYAEKEVHNGDAIPKVLNELDKGGPDLYILGQGNRRESMVLESMLEWADCPELGVVGDILASNSFGTSSSILVVQQYGFKGMGFKGSSNAQPSNQEISKDGDAESLFSKKE